MKRPLFNHLSGFVQAHQFFINPAHASRVSFRTKKITRSSYINKFKVISAWQIQSQRLDDENIVRVEAIRSTDIRVVNNWTGVSDQRCVFSLRDDIGFFYGRFLIDGEVSLHAVMIWLESVEQRSVSNNLPGVKTSRRLRPIRPDGVSSLFLRQETDKAYRGEKPMTRFDTSKDDFILIEPVMHENHQAEEHWISFCCAINATEGKHVNINRSNENGNEILFQCRFDVDYSHKQIDDRCNMPVSFKQQVVCVDVKRLAVYQLNAIALNPQPVEANEIRENSPFGCFGEHWDMEDQSGYLFQR